MENRLNYLIAGAFVALIFLTIIFVTAILPATTFQPEPTEAAYDYFAGTPEANKALRGRNIYRREGCFYCHTQFTRYQDREYGEMVQAGDYVYETPHVLGTERTGPDLSNIGGKYPDEWHVAHHLNPRKVKPGSIMPPFDHLTESEMNDLVYYLQTLGRNREIAARKGTLLISENLGEELEEGGTKKISWLQAPQELQDDWARVSEVYDVNNSAVANSGRGIFMQNCAVCHGVTGRGNGPISSSMIKKPANLTRPFYGAYSDAMWFYRIKEGVAGTRMPRWGRTLSEEQMAYLVAFVKTLPKQGSTPSADIEVTNFSQIDVPDMMNQNYLEIEHLGVLQEEEPQVYGGGRH